MWTVRLVNFDGQLNNNYIIIITNCDLRDYVCMLHFVPTVQNVNGFSWMHVALDMNFHI